MRQYLKKIKFPKIKTSTLVLGGLSVTFILILSGAMWLSGIGGSAHVATTSKHTLKSKPAKSKISRISQTKSDASQKQVSSSSESSSQPIIPESTTQNSVEYTSQTPQTVTQPSISSQETFIATVGQFTRTSEVSQQEAQQLAQAAYNAYQAEVEANRQEAERIKASIQAEDPNTQVNIIQQGD